MGILPGQVILTNQNLSPISLGPSFKEKEVTGTSSDKPQFWKGCVISLVNRKPQKLFPFNNIGGKRGGEFIYHN